ncbi:MAG: molybdenum cofactor biosynthesis protein B, partial [Natronomonas sp.]
MGDNATPPGGSESGHDAGYHDHGDDDHDHGDEDDHDHGHDSHDEHDHHHHDLDELGIAVLTISSSRSIDEDSAGDTIIDIVTD